MVRTLLQVPMILLPSLKNSRGGIKGGSRDACWVWVCFKIKQYQRQGDGRRLAVITWDHPSTPCSRMLEAPLRAPHPTADQNTTPPSYKSAAVTAPSYSAA